MSHLKKKRDDPSASVKATGTTLQGLSPGYVGIEFEAKRKNFIKAKDSDYVRRAKTGGYKDLLHMREEGQPPKEGDPKFVDTKVGEYTEDSSTDLTAIRADETEYMKAARNNGTRDLLATHKLLMKPSRLAIDPGSANAGKEWKHWIRCFDNYTSDYCWAEGASAERVDDVKLKVLINCSAPEVYERFEHCRSFADARDALDKLYLKPPTSPLIARNLLLNARQKPGQSLPDFLRCVSDLAEACAFQEASARRYADDMERDVFINGLASSEIRLALLESKDLTAEEAYDKAVAMEKAKGRCWKMYNRSSSHSEHSSEGRSSGEHRNR